jgi:hypothetical protein
MTCDELCYTAAPPLTDEVAAEFRNRGAMIVRNVLTAAEMDYFTPAVREYVTGKRELLSPSERDFGASATKIFPLGDASAKVRELMLLPKFGALAARMLGVASVRLLHFTGFFKAGGGAPTPWHQDLNYVPLDTRDMITIWMPLADLRPDSGTLVFAEGSHHHGPLDPSTGPARFRNVRHDLIRRGDVSLHLGWTLHRSAANESGRSREAVAIAYYADGARVTRRPMPFAQAMLDACFPGCADGDVAAGPDNPIVHAS